MKLYMYENRTYHNGKVIVIDAVVVDGRLKQVRVFLKPGDQDEETNVLAHIHFIPYTRRRDNWRCFDLPLGQVDRRSKHL